MRKFLDATLAGMSAKLGHEAFGRALPAKAKALQPIWRAAMRTRQPTKDSATAQEQVPTAIVAPVAVHDLPVQTREVLRNLYREYSTPGGPAGLTTQRFCLLCKRHGLLRDGVCSLPRVLQVYAGAASLAGLASAADTPPPEPGLLIEQFVAALGALARYRRPSVEVKQALIELCSSLAVERAVSTDARLGLGSDAATAQAQAPGLEAHGREQDALPGDFLAIAGDMQQRKWLRQLCLLYGANGTVQGNAAGKGIVQLTVAQAVSMLRDLAIVPHLLSAADVAAAAAASRFAPQPEATSRPAPSMGSSSCMSFEELLDMLGHCASRATSLSVQRQPGEDADAHQLCFSGQYSTDAKRYWVQDATVRDPCKGSLCHFWHPTHVVQCVDTDPTFVHAEFQSSIEQSRQGLQCHQALPLPSTLGLLLAGSFVEARSISGDITRCHKQASSHCQVATRLSNTHSLCLGPWSERRHNFPGSAAIGQAIRLQRSWLYSTVTVILPRVRFGEAGQ
jgi:hypothetical protein